MSIDKGYFVPHPPLIIPEIGKGNELKIQKTISAYQEIAKDIAKIKPDTIIISSPHAPIYADYFHFDSGKFAFGSFSNFGAPRVGFKAEYDQELIQLFSDYFKNLDFPAGILGGNENILDHATMIPLYFINQYYENYQLIRISPSGLSLISHYNLGKIINSLIPSNKKVVWVASGDLSHKLKKDGPYGLAKEGLIFDNLFTNIVKSANFSKLFKLKQDLIHQAAECGLGSFVMLSGVFDNYNVETNLLSYEGPFGVGYCVSSITRKNINAKRAFYDLEKNFQLKEMDLKRRQEDDYVKLARKSLEYYIKNNKPLPFPENLSGELINKRAGVFVTLYKDGRLRGCIGTISPVTNSIALEIINNAISSGTRDYRFERVKEAELPKLKYSVDVLFPPEKIESTNQLDIIKYGVIVRSGYKSGLLLPNIEGINSVKEQVEIAKRKAGITEKEIYSLERFEVIRHY